MDELSPFQLDKLGNFYEMICGNQETMTSKDVDDFSKKIIQFSCWKESDTAFKYCKEVFTEMKEILLRDRNEADIDQWFSMWEKLLPGKISMNELPVWLQLLPNIMFEAIDSKKDGVIDKSELMNYYVQFIPRDKQSDSSIFDDVTEAFDEMTEANTVPLNMQTFQQVFANFLFGRTGRNGPGRHLVGIHQYVKSPFSNIKMDVTVCTTTQQVSATDRDIKAPLEMKYAAI